ncbi:hypothetical protein BJY04DRAFT_229417 [Aspergillus karnatakaensis]|uniref:uncharacterized protein n=1 Tax=Aspergillus karnatakaensis TaxID=1810916 RepID=UPI003CCD5D65
MVTFSSITTALTAVGVGLLLSTPGALATPGYRKSASPGYRSSADVCPERCSVAGSNTGNWSVYPNFKQIKHCKETVFYDFSLYDPVDDTGTNHKVHACSSYGPDFAQLPPSESGMRIASASAAKPIEVEFEMGWWEEGYGLASSGLRSLVKQLRTYVDNGHGATTDRPFILYGRSGRASIGLYIGQGLLNEGFSGESNSALKIFQDNLEDLNVTTPSLAMQLCGPGKQYDGTHIFGIMTTSNGTFTPIQEAIQSWANATCLDFNGSRKFTAPATFTTPLLHGNRTITRTNSTALDRRTLHARAECTTVQVESGNGCAELATKCGISGADFTKYNPGENFCATLQPKQHVCCSAGELPDFRPDPNPDGTCFTHQVTEVDNCASLAAEYSLTLDDLEKFNARTWGWNGCQLLFKDTIMCLSSGTPPFPAPIANAVCGPQKPGSKPPAAGDDTDISEMNPCPLNACCNIWGQCGITKDFCIDTNTGAPGTAEPGSYGCISNCGLDVVKGDGTGAITIGYYEGYCLSRECLYQDATQIDTSAHTHIHFGFGTLTPDYDVEVGDILSTYQFNEFKRLSGVKRILSFGGWDFSNSDATYPIFRTGVRPENRLVMAKKIADFIKLHDLDGVDIDWEYPGAPDLPEYDPGTAEEGPNYLAFLVILKNMLPGKSVSIAAPSSYWYLKQFPIAEIGRIVDYIVYMTYDLHGQWDAHNSNSQEGCDTGNCLRSQVNLTETRQSLAMITKAGVPGRKVVVGVTSYGRSFKMAEAGCWGPECLFTGDRLNSNAKKGKCTGTAGYLADAEIEEILADPSRVVAKFVDSSSNSDILVYDDNEWVGYMSPATKRTRAKMYSAWGLGGTTDWATDLQTYHEVPAPALSWASFKSMALAGEDPKADHSRNGNWTDFNCEDPMIVDATWYYPDERWQTLGADAAWADVLRIWRDTDSKRPGISFMQSVSTTLHMGAQANCGELVSESCITLDCPAGANGETSGPAAQLIWNSLVFIHKMHADYHDALFDVAALTSFTLDDMENTFAPVPTADDNTWLRVLLNLITIGTLSAGAPFFNSILKPMPWFTRNPQIWQNSKEITLMIVGQTATMAKDLLPTNSPPWSPEAQDQFSHYMGQVINGWANITSLSLEELFSGNDEPLKILQDSMQNGKLIEGAFAGEPDDSGNAKNELRANIQKSFYGFSIPALWQASQAYPFILDSGHGCDERQLSQYLEDATMDSTGACIDGRQYYLVHPKGESRVLKCASSSTYPGCNEIYVDNKFSALPGMVSLTGSDWGSITREDIVRAAVRTWIHNGRENGAAVVDATDPSSAESLMDVDITTPGFIRLPICSAERAFTSWDETSKGSSPNFPCDLQQGKNECGETSFENQTTDGSPLVEDCLQIIRNIEEDPTTGWTTQVVGQRHRTIGVAGTCAFGVEATRTDGNVNFQVGGQDMIDIINDAVAQFAWNDKIGARGDMQCNGNVKSQAVRWGIYHT